MFNDTCANLIYHVLAKTANLLLSLGEVGQAGFGGQVAAPVIRSYFEMIARNSVPAYLSQAEKDQIAREEATKASFNTNNEIDQPNEADGVS